MCNTTKLMGVLFEKAPKVPLLVVMSMCLSVVTHLLKQHHHAECVLCSSGAHICIASQPAFTQSIIATPLCTNSLMIHLDVSAMRYLGRTTEVPSLCRLHFKHADSLRPGQKKSCSSAMLLPAATVPQLLRLLMPLR